MALLQQPKASQSPAASLLPVVPIGVVPSAGRKASGAVDRAAKSVVAAIQGGVGHTRTRQAQVPILSRALSNIDPGVLRDALPPAIKGAVLVAESQRAALAAVSSKRRSVDDRAFDSAVMTASVGVHDTPEQMRLKAAALGKRPRCIARCKTKRVGAERCCVLLDKWGRTQPRAQGHNRSHALASQQPAIEISQRKGR